MLSGRVYEIGVEGGGLESNQRHLVHLRERFGGETEAAFFHIANNILLRISLSFQTICE